ncbi:endolytic transglycosylase MltG [Sphingomonas sp. HF-S4]|uniref:Endolytic murein transglycosylase n=1 Tax=Sphingomonas agrestis TaxID=3080540 RepID=A0ABU3Y4K2_9SPHN|nr:endolytic transglycosylase MltG [Sphingomonas sp. HF-S4]MDV3456254.1 endolytic transglycosylase MltG [Sphingomonas sp. HF-S4]
MPPRRPRRRAGGCAILVVLLLVVAAGFGVLQLWAGSGPSRANMTVLVPQGASLSQAAAELEKAGAIRSAGQFVLLSRLLGGGKSIKAGEYRVPAGLSQSDLLKMLQGGQTLQRFVRVPEGTPSIVVYETLMKAPQLDGPVSVPAEGSVLPDSYAYNRGDTRQAVLDRMQKAMDAYLAKAWERRKPGIAVQTPQEALTLAAIVEKETSKPEERRTVAAVYSNRLRTGMMLQADPTIIYPITKGKPLGRRILQSELRAKNAYNTYAMTGLPAGPIANPGKESIDAVLDPAQSSALYFVADGTGGHVFADTLEQHNANVQKWYALRRARGEM